MVDLYAAVALRHVGRFGEQGGEKVSREMSRVAEGRRNRQFLRVRMLRSAWKAIEAEIGGTVVVVGHSVDH